MQYVIRRGLLYAAIVSFATSLAPAYGQDRAVIRQLSGAEQCAQTKSEAIKHRGDRPSRSLASTNFDVTYYHLNIDLDFTAPRLDGTVRVQGRVSGLPLSVLALDLADNMTVSAVRLPDATSLSFSHANDVLRITLPAAQPAGNVVAVDVTYGGRPTEDGFGNFAFGTRFDQPYAWSLSEPYGAREWWPCKDHPSDKADSVRVQVTVPDGMAVGSQGLLVSETSNAGRTTFDWRSNYPISNYLVSVTAGYYARYQQTYTRSPSLQTEFGPLDLLLEHFRYDDGTPELPEGWSDVTDVLDVLEDWFGPYPFPNEKYGHAEFNFGGGMEHQTMSSMGGSSLGLVVHEAAHQWFGDAITPQTWAHLWLNEGFATYSELLYWEVRADSFPLFWENALWGARSRSRKASGTLVLQDTSSVFTMFDGRRVYAKGAMVLHMLRSIVGDANFREILRTYAADPAVFLGNATTADFKRVAEAVYGELLDVFFRQWITEGTGYPEYALGLSVEDGWAGHVAHVTIEQQQIAPESNVDVFVMPVTIAIQTAAGEERFTVMNDKRWQRFTFTLGDEPLSVELDPDEWLLRDDPISVAAERVPNVPTLDAIFPNPLRVSGEVRFTLPRAGDVSLVLYDVAGRRLGTVASGPMGTGPQRAELLTTNLPSGVYFLRLESRAGEVVRKFVVLH